MEEVLPPQTEDGAGFEPTRIRQLTVFMENRVGRLQTLVRAYESRGGQIMGLSVQTSADTGLVRLICSDTDLAREVLHAEGFSFSEQDVLAVELPAKSRQPLMTLCAALLAGELSILYSYPLLQRPGGPALVLYLDDSTLAARLLIKKGFRILGESDLKKDAS
jgi:hypothetical protein